MLMAIATTVNGCKTKNMEKENIFMLLAPTTKVIGYKDKNME